MIQAPTNAQRYNRWRQIEDSLKEQISDAMTEFRKATSLEDVHIKGDDIGDLCTAAVNRWLDENPY